MKKLRSVLKKNGILFSCLLAAAVGIFAFSGVQTSRAVLTYGQERYTARVSVSEIGITLVENGEDISWRDYSGSDDQWRETSGELLTKLLPEREVLQIGRAYPEQISVRNTGSIDEYVRVILTRYWEGADGRQTDLSPSLIELGLAGNGWILDGNSSTEERMVLYYSRPLAAGESTASLTDTIRISSALSSWVKTETVTDENGFTTITTSFAYNGVKFMVEAEADGVQTHNAREAMKSAWGVDADIDENGILRGVTS